MKFFVNRQELSTQLIKLQTVIGQKTTLPILSNILMTAKGTEVTLTATDLTVGLQTSVEAKVTAEGATTLPAKKLTQLVRELTVPTLEVATNDTHLTEIAAGSSKFRLHGMPPTDFPTLPELNHAHPLPLAQAALKNALWRTAFAVSKEDSRYALTGVLLSIEGEKAVFIGTDGKRDAESDQK